MSRSARRRSTSADHRFALRFPTLARLVWVESVLAMSALIVVAFGVPASVVWCIAAFAILPFVVIAGRGVIDWLWTALRFPTRRLPESGVVTERTENDGRTFGVHWHRDRVTCVLEILPPRAAVTRLGRSEAHTDSHVDLVSLAECLRQHDISLSGIDVVAHGSRTAPGSPATDVYEHLIGPLPAVASRTVWVSASLSIRDNRTAIDARGGGRTGAARAIGIATERVARALAARGVVTRTLTAAELDGVASLLRRGVPTEDLTESWTAAPLPGVVSSGFGLDCRRIDTASLTDLWSVSSISTTVVLRLGPGSTPGRIGLDGECRFVSRTTRPALRTPGAVSMNGRHRDALLTSQPLGITVPGHSAPVRELSHERLADLLLPLAGCGQLLGSDASGRGVALRVHGQGLTTVLVAGELYLAQQLIFRAVATGARVLVRTDRPHAWLPLADSVAAPDRLHVDGVPLRADTRFDVIVHDRADSTDATAHTTSDGVTTVILTEQLPRVPLPDPDLSIVQPGAAGDRVFVRAGATEIELSLVTIAQETAFIGRPRSIRVGAVAQPG